MRSMEHHEHSGWNVFSTSNARILPLLFTAALGAAGCSDTSETVFVEDVELWACPLHTFETDEGYHVVLHEVEIALSSLYFTRFGEAHLASKWFRVLDGLVPSAFAHPGHSQGGEITGELRGSAVLHFSTEQPHAPVGLADLAVGTYDAVDFTFGRLGAPAGDTENPDPNSVTIILLGEAEKDATTYPFRAEIRQDLGRTVIGAPFPLTVTADTRDLAVTFDGKSRFAIDGAYPTVFDALSFEEFSGAINDDGLLLLHTEREFHNRLRNQLQKHDFYYFDAQQKLCPSSQPLNQNP